MSTRKVLKLFEKIYNETYKEVLKFVICKCNNLNDVDDILQETYLEVFKILETKKEVFEDNKFAYIITIAKNKIIKNYNSNGKVKLISMFQVKDDEEYTLDIDSGIDLESSFINKNNIEEIWKYLSDKNIVIAKIFYLHFGLDMKFKEIAESMELKESTIKTNLYRTLKDVRKKFEDGGENYE